MREEYHVTLYSQMGPREGRLDLQYEGSAVGGWASVPLSCYPDGGQHPFLRDGAGAPWGTPYWSDHGGRLPDAMGGEPDLP